MINAVQTLTGDIKETGVQGLSAYEVYKKNGGTLSEDEWLLSLKGENGITPTIGENGNWFIGNTDTGLPSRGEQGEAGEGGGISLEEVIAITGQLENLNTEDKTTLVNAINEVASKGKGIKTLTDETITLSKLECGVYIISKSVSYIVYGSYDKKKFQMSEVNNSFADKILLVGRAGTTYNVGYLFSGTYIVNLLAYNPADGNNKNIIDMCELKNAVAKEYVDTATGDLTTLATEDKSSLVNAINEVLNNSGGEITETDTPIYVMSGYNDATIEDAERLEIIKNACIDYENGKTPLILMDDTSNYYSYRLKISDTTCSISSIDYKYDSDRGFRTLTYNFNGSRDENNIFVPTKGTRNYGSINIPTKENVLTKTNTKAYTPTSDYHPVTKKYVDDLVGDISTVLATLTTVSEVSE